MSDNFAPLSSSDSARQLRGETIAHPEKPGVLPTAIMLIVLTAAFALTAYGFYFFDLTQSRLWPVTELHEFAATVAVPAAVLIGSSFARHWTRLAVATMLCVGLVTYGPAVLGIVSFAAIGFIAIGHSLFRIRLETIEDGLLALALGFGVVGLAIGLSAPVRVHFDFVYALIMIAAIFAARGQLADWLGVLWQRTNAPSSEQLVTRITGNVSVSLTLIVLIGVSLYATAMETGPDALSTHLVFSDRLRDYGFLPLDTDTWRFILMPKLTVWALSAVNVLGGEFALRAAHASLIAIAAALIAMRARRSMSRASAALLAATLVSAPVAFWVSAQFFEETGTLLLVAAAAVLYLRAENRDEYRFEWMSFAALGFAVSSKIQVLFLGGLGVALVMRRLLTDRTHRALPIALVGCLVFMVTGLGFYARAFLITGNPFFPFVPGETIDARWERPLTWSAPFDMVFHQGSMEAYAGGFAFQYILLLGAGVAALFVPRGGSARWLGLAALAFCLTLASQTLYARYQLYAFPFLMLALAAVYPFVTAYGRITLAVAMAAIVVLNMGFWRSVHVPPFSFSHLLSPQITSYIPPERRAFDAIDSLYGRNSVVFVASSRPVAAGSLGTVHVNSRIAHEINAAPTIRDVAAKLREGKVTHVVLSGEPVNVQVLSACELACKEFPLRPELALRVFQVDPMRMGMLNDRTDAAELFSLPPTAEAVPLSGWGQREAWGWWSVESEAKVKLSGFEGVSELNLRLQPFAPPGTAGLEVRVSLDDVHVADWRFEPTALGTTEDRIIRLPRAIRATDPAILRFEFSRTYKPKEVLGNSDERTLALGLISVTR